MDRLVFEKLIKFIGDRYSKRKTTEVVEVHGKENFEQYRRVLDIVKMPTSVIADQDYILNIGTDAIKPLFISDSVGIDRKVLLDKKSRDSKTLIEAIEEAANNQNFEKVSDIIEYIKGRCTKLKDEITKEEEIKINNFIAARASEGTYILRWGEIEYYLPKGVNSPGKLIDLLKDQNWTQQHEPEARTEILDIVIAILELPDKDKEALHAEFKIKKVA